MTLRTNATLCSSSGRASLPEPRLSHEAGIKRGTVHSEPMSADREFTLLLQLRCAEITILRPIAARAARSFPLSGAQKISSMECRCGGAAWLNFFNPAAVSDTSTTVARWRRRSTKPRRSRRCTSLVSALGLSETARARSAIRIDAPRARESCISTSKSEYPISDCSRRSRSSREVTIAAARRNHVQASRSAAGICSHAAS